MARPQSKRALALAEELAGVFKANPLQRYNHPNLPNRHLKQLEFHAAQTKIKALIAGNRAGKTVGCLVDDLIQAVDEDVLPPHLLPFKKWQPPFDCWISAPNYSKHWDSIIPLIRKFAPADQLRGGSFDKAFSKQKAIVYFANGSTFVLKTHDQDVDSYASAAIHRMHWDEEPEGEHGYQIRQEARARLISTGGDEIMGLTPLLGYSWVYDDVWERRHEDHITVVQASMWDNPHNDPEEIESYLSGLGTEEERAARGRGEFVHFGGKFYPEFRDTPHVVDPPEREHLKGQAVVVGIDPGLHTTGIVFVAFDNDNAAFVFDEAHPVDALPRDIAEIIREKNKKWGVTPDYYVIDPSARNRATVNAESVESALAREGIYAVHGQNDRAAGILEVKKRLQGTPPSLLVSRDCPHLIWEFGRYRRDSKAADEWAAIKVDDDELDALRYVCLSRAWSAPEPPPSRPSRRMDEAWPVPNQQSDFAHPTGSMT